MTASSKPMVSAIAMAAKRFSSVPRWCTHHLVSRRFLHRATERHNKPLCMNTAAPFGSVHFCHMRASSTASAPSAVGFDNYDHETEGKNKLAFWWIDDNRNELKWTFQQLSDLSKRTSNILLGPCQLTPGDRVVVILPRVPEWWLLNIASCRMGVVLIPGTTQLTPRDIHHRLLRSGAKCIITDAATANDVDQVQTKSDDPLQIYFTSGTTGEPKMTQQTHSSYGLASLITGKYWLDLTPSDIHWNLSDTGWAKSAWSSVFAPWTQGACVFVHHSPKFTPQRVLQVLEKYPISTFCATPTAYRMLVLENFAKYNLSSIRHCVSAGEPL
ncbi:Acyl-coenzyme A synthetase ACSM3, mitochondrial, partial [Lamellibrachia satsuma]